MSDSTEPVAIRHPSFSGEVYVVSRLALPAYTEAGWVEAKSPEAKAAVEAAAPQAAPTPKEGKS